MKEVEIAAQVARASLITSLGLSVFFICATHKWEADARFRPATWVIPLPRARRMAEASTCHLHCLLYTILTLVSAHRPILPVRHVYLFHLSPNTDATPKLPLNTRPQL